MYSSPAKYTRVPNNRGGGGNGRTGGRKIYWTLVSWGCVDKREVRESKQHVHAL